MIEKIFSVAGRALVSVISLIWCITAKTIRLISYLFFMYLFACLVAWNKEFVRFFNFLWMFDSPQVVHLHKSKGLSAAKDEGVKLQGEGSALDRRFWKIMCM